MENVITEHIKGAASEIQNHRPNFPEYSAAGWPAGELPDEDRSIIAPQPGQDTAPVPIAWVKSP
jgi:hypothetical protein